MGIGKLYCGTYFVVMQFQLYVRMQHVTAASYNYVNIDVNFDAPFGSIDPQHLP